jgi:hypothetical protein
MRRVWLTTTGMLTVATLLCSFGSEVAVADSMFVNQPENDWRSHKLAEELGSGWDKWGN